MFSRKRFRPLTGIMVLIEVKNFIDKYYRLYEFPSPYGDYGSYRRWLNQSLFASSNVSVPLRGLWFLSADSHEVMLQLRRVVSVPLRGLWFLSAREAIPSILMETSFPSPYGDYGSYQ